MTRTRINRLGLLLGRFAGLILAGAGVFAGLSLFSEFKVWTDSFYIQVALLIPTGGAVAFALIQGGRMLFAKATTDFGFSRGMRVFGVAIFIASLLLAIMLKLPAAAAGGPIAVVAVILQGAVVITGFVPLLRSGDWRRQDGA